MAVFCWGTVVFLIARDLTIEAVGNTEVWFGFELTGVWARRTAPLHWALFAMAGWAFWRQWRGIWSASIAYAVLIAVSHLVWNVTSPSGGGLRDGLVQTVLFSIPAVVLGAIRPRGSARIRSLGD